MIKAYTVIVTGASSGIGLELCEQLTEKGAEVVGLSRTRPDFESGSFRWFPLDVRKADEVSHVARSISAQLRKPLFGLVNNAGIGRFEAVDKMTIDSFSEIIETNVNGTFYMCNSLVPLLKKEGKGHIINISSVAGLHGIANGSVYSASKFAVRGFSHSLFKELRKFNIKVTCVYPGSVATAFFEEVEGVENNPKMLKAEDVAAKIIQELESPPNTCSLDLEIRALQTT